MHVLLLCKPRQDAVSLPDSSYEALVVNVDGIGERWSGSILRLL
jgi:hypothetical protein